MPGLAERLARPAAPLPPLSALQTHGRYCDGQTPAESLLRSSLAKPRARRRAGQTSGTQQSPQSPAQPCSAPHSPATPGPSEGIPPGLPSDQHPAHALCQQEEGLARGSEQAPSHRSSGLFPCPQTRHPRLRSWLLSAVRSPVGSLEPLTVSWHDYPMSHLGNTSTEGEATETLSP